MFSKPIKQKPDDFNGLIKLIKSINPNVKFLFIEQYTEGVSSINKTKENDNLMWIRFTSSGRNTGVKYLDRIDDTIAKMVYSSLK